MSTRLVLLAVALSGACAWRAGAPLPTRRALRTRAPVCAEGDADEPAWFDDAGAEPAAAAPTAEAPPPAPAAEAAAPPATTTTVKPPEPAAEPEMYLEESDLYSTKWSIVATPREDSWMQGGPQEQARALSWPPKICAALLTATTARAPQEFVLLKDGGVVWGGSVGGFGVGGRWQLRGDMLEVIRTTPLGLVTGRDYYMSIVKAKTNAELQFELQGIIRSYNALYPVTVIADFVATRQAGRFERNDDDDES